MCAINVCIAYKIPLLQNQQGETPMKEFLKSSEEIILAPMRADIDNADDLRGAEPYRREEARFGYRVVPDRSGPGGGRVRGNRQVRGWGRFLRGRADVQTVVVTGTVGQQASPERRKCRLRPGPPSLPPGPGPCRRPRRSGGSARSGLDIFQHSPCPASALWPVGRRRPYQLSRRPS